MGAARTIFYFFPAIPCSSQKKTTVINPADQVLSCPISSQVCLDLVRLLHFLSDSPLGSVALLDFQPRQFVTVSGQLKLTDLDDASAAETSCRTHADCTLQFPHRNFTVLCSARGMCEGLNEKRNIYNAYR